MLLESLLNVLDEDDFLGLSLRRMEPSALLLNPEEIWDDDEEDDDERVNSKLNGDRLLDL